MLRYVLVDVFTRAPWTGNPLAVFTEASGLSAETMQALARELNLSETTFVCASERGGTARVRIFTPKAEIPFAGHPTLGTALVLGTATGADEVTLELGVGLVPVRLERESGVLVGGWFSRPTPPPIPFSRTADLLVALDVNETASPVVLYDSGVRHLVVHLNSAADVLGLRPDYGALAELPTDTIDVVALDGPTAHLRVFAPAHGILEDPATGSAAAPIHCHLTQHTGLDPGATLSISQGTVLKRPSWIQVRASERAGMIDVGGGGVIVGRGEFDFPRA